jgi:hypothetical protein
MTSHGFRSTASTLLNESGKWSPDAIERALAHGDTDNVRAGAVSLGPLFDVVRPPIQSSAACPRLLAFGATRLITINAD